LAPYGGAQSCKIESLSNILCSPEERRLSHFSVNERIVGFAGRVFTVPFLAKIPQESFKTETALFFTP